MDITSAKTIEHDIRKILILGPPFSNKTGSLATLPRPLLVFAGDVSVERRLAGLDQVDLVLCYDKQGEKEGEGIRRFDRNLKELMCMKTIPYKSVAIDPYNFFHDDKFLEYAGINKNDKRGAYGELKEYGTRVIKQLTGLPTYVAVVCHVKLKEDMTTGQEAFLPALDGSLKDSIAGRFDAVFYTKVIPVPMKPPKYMLRVLASNEYHAGIKTPVGKEHLFSTDLEPDYTKIIGMLKGEQK